MRSELQINPSPALAGFAAVVSERLGVEVQACVETTRVSLPGYTGTKTRWLVGFKKGDAQLQLACKSVNEAKRWLAAMADVEAMRHG